MFGGHFAAEIEGRTDRSIVEQCISVLKDLYGDKVTPPLDYYVTRWKADPFARGR